MIFQKSVDNDGSPLYSFTLAAHDEPHLVRWLSGYARPIGELDKWLWKNQDTSRWDPLWGGNYLRVEIRDEKVAFEFRMTFG